MTVGLQTETEESTFVQWEGVLGVEGTITGDGRLIEHGALEFGELPHPFRFVREDVGAHDGAVVVGSIQEITRQADGVIFGRGRINVSNEDGKEAARLIREELSRGCSMDLDKFSFEIRVAGELLEDDDGVVEEEESLEAASEDDSQETDDEGRVTVGGMEYDDEVLVITSARLRSATLVAVPAFAEALISLVEEEDTSEDTSEDEDMATATVPEAVVASSAPVLPPLAWFENPHLPGPSPLTVTKEGRVFGHLATWGTCHTGMNDVCIDPPRSASDYAYFLLGSLETEEGTEVPVGRITLDTTHAGPKLSQASATAHYENTGNVVADVTVGEDQFGIWFSGALRSTVSKETLRAFKAAPLSGDWRRVGSALELVAALAVNQPGFPIPRTAGLAASGSMFSLTAAGLMPPKKIKRPGAPGALSVEDIRYLKGIVERDKVERATTLAQRVKRIEARRKVEAFARKRDNDGL